MKITRYPALPLWAALLLALLYCAAKPLPGLAQASLPASLSSPLTQPGGNFSGLPSERDFLPVEQAYVFAGELQEDGTLRLYWQIADEYYLYRDQFAATLSDARGAVETQLDLPPGLRRTDEFFGEVEVYYGHADLVLLPSRPLEGPVQLAVRSQGCADAGLCYPPRDQFFSVDLGTGQLSEVGAPEQPEAAAQSAAIGLLTLVLTAAMAFVGGMLLNLMPCVFPVLALKVYGLSQGSTKSRVQHGWAYTLGVVASFLAVAGLLLALQQAGKAVGWGFQLQSAGFVLTLATLFTVMALLLMDFIPVSSRISGLGQTMTQRGGFSGSFFTGVLATVVASPCTAPFMGTAMGVAITQSTPIALLIFASLGLGMAAPMLLLSMLPGLSRLLPRPGPWMAGFKQLLAFPLLATAVWLLWVFGKQTSVDGVALALVGLLLAALAMWSWGAALSRRSVAAIVAALALTAMTEATRQESSAERTTARSGQISYSEQSLARHLSDGRPVFLDVTADWCITCLANERQVLKTTATQQLFASRNVVYMIADWTQPDAAISQLLAKYQRAGIPLYILYDPANPQAPTILPQILTHRIVADAVQGLQTRRLSARESGN
jgi:thiol:disulfide interchange protein